MTAVRGLGDEGVSDPHELEPRLIACQHAGDVGGMVALYEPDAVLDPGDGGLIFGSAAIAAFFADAIEAGHRYVIGAQNPSLVAGDLALTSTTLPDGSVTAEVARRQPDGTWRWAIDRFMHAATTPASNESGRG